MGSKAFDGIWLDGRSPEKPVKWAADVEKYNIDAAMYYDNGRGIIAKDAVEPIYADRYLPRKFKIGVTVVGDNSIDIYTNDIGVVVLTDQNGQVDGFNIMWAVVWADYTTRPTLSLELQTTWDLFRFKMPW